MKKGQESMNGGANPHGGVVGAPVHRAAGSSLHIHMQGYSSVAYWIYISSCIARARPGPGPGLLVDHFGWMCLRGCGITLQQYCFLSGVTAFSLPPHVLPLAHICAKGSPEGGGRPRLGNTWWPLFCKHCLHRSLMHLSVDMRRDVMSSMLDCCHGGNTSTQLRSDWPISLVMRV